MEEKQHGFVVDLGLRLRAVGDEMHGSMQVVPELLDVEHGGVQVGALLTAADVLIGQLANRATPAIALTVDLVVQLLRPVGIEGLTMTARLVKVGRTLLAGEATFTGAGGAPAAWSWGTFMASPRPADAGAQADEEAFAKASRFAEPQFERPLAQALGIRQPAPGVAEVDRRTYTLQPTGTLQGGVVATLGEVAASSLLGRPITQLDVRYLNGVRAGSGRATAVALGPRLARVEIVDTERSDRVAAIVIAHADDL